MMTTVPILEIYLHKITLRSTNPVGNLKIQVVCVVTYEVVEKFVTYNDVDVPVVIL
jgi:hypothetical protein